MDSQFAQDKPGYVLNLIHWAMDADSLSVFRHSYRQIRKFAWSPKVVGAFGYRVKDEQTILKIINSL